MNHADMSKILENYIGVSKVDILAGVKKSIFGIVFKESMEITFSEKKITLSKE